MWNPGAKLETVAVLAVGIFCFLGRGPAFAQSAAPIPLPDAGELLFAPPSLGAIESLEPPSAEYTGIHAGPWTIFPTVFSGLAFNDNIYQTTTNRVADAAWRLTPSIYATNNNGINNFAVYGALDSYVYLRNSNADVVNGRVGLQDKWEIERDLIFKFSADLSRQTDTAQSGQVVGSTTVEPIRYWQYQTNASLLKSFNRFFVGVGGSFVNSTYDNAALTGGSSIDQSYRDLNLATFSARGGLYVGPTIYAYTEASQNTQIYYNDAAASSHGYRVVGGVGSDQLSLFKGEIYGGYQQQYYTAALGGEQNSPVFGGRVSWFPTQFITVTANADDSFGASAASSLTPSQVSASNTATANLAVNYALAATWSAAAHVSFADTTYTGSSRVDHDYGAGLTLNRQIWQNLAGTFDYQLNSVQSNYVNASYVQNIVSLGLTYKY